MLVCKGHPRWHPVTACWLAGSRWPQQGRETPWERDGAGDTAATLLHLRAHGRDTTHLLTSREKLGSSSSRAARLPADGHLADPRLDHFRAKQEARAALRPEVPNVGLAIFPGSRPAV